MHKFSVVWALKTNISYTHSYLCSYTLLLVLQIILINLMLSVISSVFCMHISIFYIVFLHAGFVKDSEMLMELESFFLHSRDLQETR